MLRTDNAGRRTMDDGRWTMDAGPSAPYYKLTGELKRQGLMLACIMQLTCIFVINLLIKICLIHDKPTIA